MKIYQAFDKLYKDEFKAALAFLKELEENPNAIKFDRIADALFYARSHIKTLTLIE